MKFIIGYIIIGILLTLGQNRITKETNVNDVFLIIAAVVFWPVLLIYDFTNRILNFVANEKNKNKNNTSE